jgi:hypothetical protein
MADPINDLSDPDYAAFAWGRYKRLMLWMAVASAMATAGGLGILWWLQGPLPLLFMAFTAGGIFLSVMLAAALMGLVFLSSGTGHDEQIQDLSEDGSHDH